MEGKPLKQTIHCARLKRSLDPVDEVEEFDNSDSECAGGQEAANGKGMGDSVHHEENDNDKEQGCQNEEQKSHTPEQREIMEPVSNAELDLQQEEYALSKDKDVSLWIDFPVTGSQEFHEELHLLITTYMIHKSTDPMLSSLGSPDGSMESYMKRLRVQTLDTWATELEVIAATSLLNATIYTYAKCEETFMAQAFTTGN
ncbi:hypothetical protein EMCRGX_G003442 [Ephydatia muelleri]